MMGVPKRGISVDRGGGRAVAGSGKRRGGDGAKSAKRGAVEAAKAKIQEWSAAQPERPDLVAYALIEAGFEQLMAPYRVPSTPDEAARVKAHYKDATAESLRSHLNDEGVVQFIATLSLLGAKHLDYQPATNSDAERAQDLGPGRRVLDQVSGVLEDAFAAVGPDGPTHFGVAAKTITNGAVMAVRHGVPIEQVAKILTETLSHIVKEYTEVDAPLTEDQIIDFMAQQLGVSRATAKRYAAEAKALGPEFFGM